MILEIPLKSYASQLEPHINTPVSLDVLLQPFKLQGTCQNSDFLLVGHILESLLESFSSKATIDPFDVASAAWELGYDEAGDFLDNGPLLVYQLLKQET